MIDGVDIDPHAETNLSNKYHYVYLYIISSVWLSISKYTLDNTMWEKSNTSR